jgi:hypothetical protein
MAVWDWNQRAGEHNSSIYADAACRVSEWMSQQLIGIRLAFRWE